MLNLMGIAAKGLMGRELVVRTEEVEDFRAMEASSNSVGEVVFSESLPYKFSKFSNLLGMLVKGFEKETSSLMRKMEARKGRGVKISGEKRKTC